jgi:hypothetical protein
MKSDKCQVNNLSGPELVGLTFLALSALLFVTVCAGVGAWLGWRAGVTLGIGAALGSWARGQIW